MNTKTVEKAPIPRPGETAQKKEEQSSFTASVARIGGGGLHGEARSNFTAPNKDRERQKPRYVKAAKKGKMTISMDARVVAPQSAVGRGDL